jgi:HK97 family phage portal protein|tara:strand:+ start:621 stop:3545 length:2925 start_codon:yes stop_codon:yes gene_type:complete
MANDIARSEPVLLRVLRALGLADVSPETGEAVHVAGADFASGQPATPGYPVVNSLSTVAAFPYVNAAMNAIAADLASLDLRVKLGRGSDAELIEDHPVLSLMERPSSRVSGDHLRRQIASDLVLCGDAYVLVSGRDQPEVLLRLHPARVKVVPMSDGQVSHYEYNGAGRAERYEYEQILHFRMTSWEDDPRGLYGNGAIRALSNDLTTDRLASELAAASAKTGRPTTVFSPSDPTDVWSDSQLKQMRRTFDAQMAGTGGALFLGGSAKMESLQFTPRDLEYKDLKKGVVESILAVFDCPPTRLGGSSVNYATAAQQAKHWWSGLQSKAKILDGQWTRLARMFPGFEDSDLHVFHDFSGVEALQESRDSRVNRVLTWVTMGVPLYDAAAYEGFDDLPGMDAEDEVDETSAPAGDGDQPVSATALNGAQVASLIAILEQVSAGLLNEDAAVALIGAAFPTVPEDEARRIVAGAQPLTAPEAPQARGLGDLSEPVQTGLRNRAREHNEEIDDEGMAEWRKTSARTLASVFERGVGAYETNPESVRPSVNSPDQWAYARVRSFLYALKNDEFRSGKHDQDLLPEEHPMSTKSKSAPVRRDYESIDFKVPKGVVSELKRGLAWHELGLSGDGLKPATVSWARRMANGESISPDKARKMRAWLARHESDKAGEGFDPGEDGYPSPGRVAWALWGGDPAKSWSAKIVGQMEKEDEKKSFAGSEAGDIVWKSFIERVHGPSEEKLENVLRRYLLAAGARAAQRLKKEIDRVGPTEVTRQAPKELVDAVLDELAEAAILKSAVEAPMREIFEAAVQDTFDQMPPEYSATMAPVRVDRAVNAQIGALVKDWRPYTRAAIADVVETGITEGATIAEMQEAIQRSRAYTPARALRIARTETTRAVNAGTVSAYGELSDAGFEVRYRWLSSRDKATRDNHRALENHPPVRPGEKFRIDGYEADAPGGFGEAEMDVNCRCTLIPHFED